MSLNNFLAINSCILSHLQRFLDLQDLITLTRSSRSFKIIFQAIIQNRLIIFQQHFIKQIHLESLSINKNSIQKQQLSQSQTPNKNKLEDKKSTQKSHKSTKPQVKMIIIENNLIGFKTNINMLPCKFLACQAWQETSWKQVENWLNLKNDNPKSSNKFVDQQHCNLNFLSNDGRLMLSINRSMVDPALNYVSQVSQYDERDEARQYLKSVAESSEYDASDTDLSSMQEILSRQKKILNKLGQLQQVRKEINNFVDKPNLKNVYNLRQYAIILCHGGYFALGVFDKKGLCIYHKSDHKYVKRGKQGQRQITKDSNAGSNVKSMGSQIRREQEKKLQVNVSNILNEAFSILEICDVLFLQAPGINLQLLVEDQEPLFKLQHKLRSICLTAKKATYTEVERIHKALNQVWIVQRNEVQEELQFF